MAPDRYDVSGSVSDSLHEAAKASPLYNFYEPSLDFNPNSIYYQSNAGDYLPSITIDDVKTVVSDALKSAHSHNVERHAHSSSTREHIRKSDDDGFTINGKKGEMQFAANRDGTYTHVVEKGDTYWEVARSVLMAQKGIENPYEVDNQDITRMVTRLQKFNDKPTTGDEANKLAIGEEIFIPRSIGDDIEEKLDEEENDESEEDESDGKHEDSDDDSDRDSDESGDEESSESEDDDEYDRAEELERKLENAKKGFTRDEMQFGPVDGIYNPLQPPGMELNKVGDYGDGDIWNYDVEARTDEKETIDANSGVKTIRYSGQVDSGYGVQNLAFGYWKDTEYDAVEKVNKNGIVTQRKIDYHGSTVKMNFKDAMGETIDDYVRAVESNLDPKSGNYKSTITMADGSKYEMMVSRQNGEVIQDSIKLLN